MIEKFNIYNFQNSIKDDLLGLWNKQCEIIDWINQYDCKHCDDSQSPESTVPNDKEGASKDTRKGCEHTLNYLECEDCKVKDAK